MMHANQIRRDPDRDPVALIWFACIIALGLLLKRDLTGRSRRTTPNKG